MTLLFLVLETRENTNAIHAQTYQALTSELNDLRLYIAANDILSLRRRINEDETSLETEEREELVTVFQAVWAVYETAFYSYNRGVLGDVEWTRFKVAICRNRDDDRKIWGAPGVRGTIANNTTREFVEYVDSNCRAGEIV